MALLTITFTNGAVMEVDDSAQVRVPAGGVGGRVTASTLSEGDLVCMFPDGTEVYEIQSIE